MGPSWQRVRMACPKCMSALWSWCAVGQSGLSPHQMSRFQVDVELFSVSSVFPMQFFSSICKTKKKGHERKRDIQCAKVDIGPFFSSSACSADNTVGVWGSDWSQRFFRTNASTPLELFSNEILSSSVFERFQFLFLLQASLGFLSFLSRQDQKSLRGSETWGIEGSLSAPYRFVRHWHWNSRSWDDVFTREQAYEKSKHTRTGLKLMT